MAGKRYKAGTIFLDVAPSFDQVQERIKRFVERDNGINRALEKQGEEAGKAYAKGEAKGLEQGLKDQEDLLEKHRVKQVSKAKAHNKAVISHDEQMWDAQVKNVVANQKAETKAVEREARKRTALRRTEVEEAKNLQAQRNAAHIEAIKERDRREKESAARQKAIQKAELASFGRLWRDAQKNQQTILKQIEANENELANLMAEGRENAARIRREADEEQYRNDQKMLARGEEILDAQYKQQAAANDELANLMAEGRENAARIRREADEEQYRRDQENIARGEEVLDAQYKQQQKHWDEITKVWDRAHRMDLDFEKKKAKERENIVAESGGRIGKLIRKSVGQALVDLPEIKITEDSSENEKTLAKIRERLFTLKNYNIGVDIDADSALAEVATLRTELATLERNRDGSVNINVGAALASLKAVDDSIDKVKRKAARPTVLRIIARMTGDTGRKLGGVGDGVNNGLLGLRGSGEDGANAFRIFNAMVLAVVAGLSLLAPLLSVAAAGLATLAGAAIAGGAALGVLALGFQGVVSAIQDQIKAEDDQAKKAATTARTRATGDRQVQAAKERLADAERNAARTSADAARQVTDAERNRVKVARDAARSISDAERAKADAATSAAEAIGDAEERLADAREAASESIASAVETQRDAEQRLRDAQEDSARAQRDLNEARREARRDLEDLAFAYDKSKLDEKEAAIAIAQAQERLNETRRRASRGDASYADVRDAEVGVEQARLRAREATVRRRRAGADSAEAKRKGIEGSDQVVSAKERIADAKRAEEGAAKAARDAAKNVAKARRDAAESVADAEKNLTKTRQAGARSVADAERNLADARRDGAEAVANAERQVADARRAQARTAEDNARAIQSAKKGITDAQQSVAETSEAMSTAAYDAQKSMSDLTPEGRRFAKFILGLRGGFKELRNIAQAGMLPGLEAGMRELGIYESGFKKFVGDMSKMWGDSFRSMGKQLTNPTWRSFFHTLGQDGPRQAGLLNQAIFNVAETIAALTDAFSPLTTEMLTWLEGATRGWANWAASLKGSPGFERFLGYVERTAPIVRDLFLSLGRALINMGVALAPFAEGAMKALTNFFEFIAGMDPKVLGQIAVAFIALVIGVQLMAGAMSLASGAMIALTNPIALLILGITALSVWMIHLYQTNDTARKYIDKMLGALKALGGWLLENRKVVGGFVAAIAGMVIFAKVGLWIAIFVTKAKMGIGIAGKLAKVLKLVGLAAKFMFGPWGIAIAIVIAGLIYLWKTNDGFRDGVMRAWGAIKRAMAAVADWWTQTGSPAMGRAFDWLAKNVLPVLVTALRWVGKVGLFALKLLTTYWTFAFKAIAAIARWLWGSILKPVFTELSRWIKEIIAPAVRWLWQNVIAPSFRAIGRAGRAVWNDHLKPSFKLINHFIKTILGPAFRWLWKNVISPVFRWIGGQISRTTRKVILPMFRFMRNWIKNVVGPAFKWLWEKAVRPAIRAIGKIISWVWRHTRPNFDKMKKGLDNLRKAFLNTRDGIARIWEKVVNKIKGPLQDAMAWIDKHFLSKVRDVLNNIGAEDLAKKIPNLSGGSKSSGKRTTAQRRKVGSSSGGVQAYADGGRIQGPYRGARADNVLGIDYSGVPTAWVNPKEYILPVKATEQLTRQIGHGGMEALRNGRLPGYAKGGIVALGKRLQKMGYHVSEHPAFGGVAPGAHAPNGYHYKAGALDINADAFNSKFKNEMAALDKLNKMLRSEGWNTIWRAPNHYDHLHVDVRNGQGGLGSLVGGWLEGLAGKVADQGSKALTSILDKMPGADTFAGKMAISPMKMVAENVAEKVKTYAEGMDDGDAAGSGGGPGVDKWRTHVRKALYMLGQSPSLASRVLMQMRTESGGDPGVVNRWDSNWKAGHPSVGLMQVIRGTYARFKHPKYDKGPYKYGVSIDPMANILASMRYAIATYGSLSRAYRGTGYATGTDSATAGWHMVGENGPELMRFRGGEQVYNRQETMRLAELATRGGGSGGVSRVYVQNPWTGEYHEAQMQRIVDENADFNESVGRMG